ncbi:MAG: glycoside hydrolase family 9 protein, partial [Lachnospiraceae bacterium]|nr:glycoside hydrolase family 9 protein [Lachnospiraceae bacterium]
WVMCMTLVFSLAGCGKSNSSSSKADATEEGVTEELASASSDNMIMNGDFSDGTIGKWNTYTNGGDASLSVKDGEMAIHILKPGTLDYAVQAYYDGFALDSGCKYDFSFDVHSDVDRFGEWRMQINGGDYHAYTSDIVEIKNDVSHVQMEFEMTEASDPAPRLCLNLGMVEGCPSDLGEHTVYVDNFDLHLVDDSNKVADAEEVDKPDVNLNQLGYKTGDIKKAVVRGVDLSGKAFKVVNVDSDETVFEGKLSDEQLNPTSGETVAIADFSDVKDDGKYKVVTDDFGESYEFAIGDKVYSDLLKDTVVWFYTQRCGAALSKDVVGDFAHDACHTSKATIYGTNKQIEVNGGWHDAGDYGRYVVAGAKAAYDLMDAYENNPDAFGDDWNMPYSDNGIPDILDEVDYELKWLMKMQDKDGGVYHKVTTAAFEDSVMPDEVKDELIVCPKSNAATGTFAAVMAKASRVYEPFNSISDNFKNCREKAIEAIDYLKAHQGEPGFKNPEDISTGEYPDNNSMDELFWGLSECLKTYERHYMNTGTETEITDSLCKDIKELVKVKSSAGGLGWQGVGYYAALTYLSCEHTDKDVKAEVTDYINYAVNRVIDNAKSDGYQSTMGETYYWGSNMSILNNGMLLKKMAEIDSSKKDEYEAFAKEQINYVLGKNSNSYCFVTGYGSLSPTDPHHRPSEAKKKPVKGMIVGGANSNLEDPYAKATLNKVAAAKCYVDNVQSYSCNEVTIYWNSPLV